MSAICLEPEFGGNFQPGFGPGFAVVGSVPEPGFAGLAALAAQVGGTRSAAIVERGSDGLRFLGRHEFPEVPPGFAAWLERGACASAIHAEPDFPAPSAFALLAGTPLTGPDGSCLGMLCVADPQPRELAPEQRSGLVRLAEQVVQLLELRRMNRQLDCALRFAGATINALRANLCVLDERGTILATNASWEHFTRLNFTAEAPPGSLVGSNYLDVCEQATGAWSEGAAQFAQGVRSVVRGERSVFTVEYPCHSPTGQRWFLARVTQFEWQASVRVVVTHEDISERRQAELERVAAEKRSRQLGRVLGVISDVNQAISRASDPAEVMAAVCDITVAKGGVSMAWIGLLREPGQKVSVAASAGADRETLDQIATIFRREPAGCGCHFTEAALESGVRAVCNDIAADPRTRAWRPAALARGYRSMCSLPLRVRGQVAGCLNLYAAQAGFFSEEEVRLLVELAADLSFGLEVCLREADRLRTEQELLAAHNRYRALVNEVDAVVWEADPRTMQFTFVSERGETLLGYPARQWLEEPDFWARHVHPEDREEAVRFCVGRTALGEAHDFEYRMLTADGRVVWVRDYVTVELEQGRPVRLRGLLVDVTGHKREEAELKDKSALLQAIMDTSVAAITGVDLAGRIIYANPQAEKVLGLTRDALLRREYNSPEWHSTAPGGGPLPDALQPFRRVLGSGAPVFNVEHAIDWPDGRRHQLSINGAPIKNDRGEITSLVFSINDITERKLAEQRLQQLSAVVEQSTENILITDRRGVIQYVNRAFEQSTGFTLDEVLGRTPRILNSGKLPREFFARLWATLNAGQTFSAEFINCRRSGELFYVDQIIAPLRDSAGAITHFVSVGRDITDRKQAEQAIRDEQVINRTLLENLAAIFFVFNRDGKILRWNRALEVELGVTGDQLRAGHPLDFVVPADRDTAQRGIQRTFDEGNARVELQLQGPDARSAPFYVVTRAVELNGEPVLVGLGFDLRERREAEAEIRRLAAFPGLNPEPVLEFAADGSLRYRNLASDALARTLGAGEFVQLLPPGTAGIVRDCLASGQPRLRLETVFGGHTLSWSFFPIADQRRVHGYVSDITDRVRQELMARRSQRLESIGTLAGGIAHDLNNTLTPITMGIQMFRHENPGHSELADTIEQSALRAANMVRQLLAFAKGVGGRRVALDPRQLVRDLRQIIGSTFPKNIQLRIEVAEHLPGLVGDPTQLHQVLLNLCVNARDAMPAGGILTLACFGSELDAAAATRVLGARPGHFVVLRVTDTGTGIDPAHLERIFDPFFTTKGAEQGTGLGLSNAMGILRGHNGFIHVRSQPEMGATFEVYLPVAETAAARPDSPTPLGQLPSGAGQTILFVDDEKPVSQVAGRLLTRLGYHPLVANSAAEGLQHLRQHGDKIAAIITDLQMPGMDGLEFARAIRAIRATVPILVASGRLDDSVAESFRQLGVRLRLDKPFTSPQLAELLAETLKEPTPGAGGNKPENPSVGPQQPLAAPSPLSAPGEPNWRHPAA